MKTNMISKNRIWKIIKDMKRLLIKVCRIVIMGIIYMVIAPISLLILLCLLFNPVLLFISIIGVLLLWLITKELEYSNKEGTIQKILKAFFKFKWKIVKTILCSCIICILSFSVSIILHLFGFGITHPTLFILMVLKALPELLLLLSLIYLLKE